MSSIIHVGRTASYVPNKASVGLQLQRQLRHHLLSQKISTTPHLAAVADPEGAKTAQKKVKKDKKGPSATKLAAQESQANKIAELLIKAHDAPHRKPPPASAEEMERRYNVGRNYVIGSFNRHNEQNHDLAVKIRMKRHALKMLPKEGGAGDEIVNGESVYGRWKREALKLNDNWGPPQHRHVPMLTPPIEGFDIDLYMNMEEEED